MSLLPALFMISDFRVGGCRGQTCWRNKRDLKIFGHLKHSVVLYFICVELRYLLQVCEEPQFCGWSPDKPAGPNS